MTSRSRRVNDGGTSFEACFVSLWFPNTVHTWAPSVCCTNLFTQSKRKTQLVASGLLPGRDAADPSVFNLCLSAHGNSRLHTITSALPRISLFPSLCTERCSSSQRGGQSHCWALEVIYEVWEQPPGRQQEAPHKQPQMERVCMSAGVQRHGPGAL